MTKNLALVATALAATCMLAACSSDEGAQVQSASSETASAAASSNVASGGEVQGEYDTGDYPTTYRTPFKEMTEFEGGNVSESNNIANASILGFEVDPELTELSGARNLLSPSHTFSFLLSETIDDLKALNSPFQSGYYTSSENSDKTKSLLNAIIRFESPEKAQAAAQTLHDSLLASEEGEGANSDLYADDENYQPYTETILEGKPNTLIAEKQKTDFNDKSKVKTILGSATTHNEFLLYNFTTDLSGDAKAGKERINSYLDKQIPLLDTIATHKTDDGYGKLENWTTVDPEGLTRYAVQTPEGFDYPSMLGGLNARGFATTQINPEISFKTFDIAGIENVGTWETSVLQAKNADNAKVFQSAYIAGTKDYDYRDYDEPQNLPDTSCVTRDEAMGGGFLECVMVYEDKVALGSQAFYKPYESDSDSTDINSAAPTTSEKSKGKATNFEEAKKLLSQKMAAQLAVFKDAKENPEGTKPKAAASVDPNASEPDSATSETAVTTSKE